VYNSELVSMNLATATQVLSTTQTIKEAVKNEATPVEKLGAFVGGLGGVKASTGVKQDCHPDFY
jgi:hypothetical protein